MKPYSAEEKQIRPQSPEDASGRKRSGSIEEMIRRYRMRERSLYRLFRPPLPLIINRYETHLPSIPGLKLFVGGAGRKIRPGYINLDLAQVPGVDVVADVELLPFNDESFVAIECDAVLEHVRKPERAVSEFWRVLRPGGYLHVVVPFCHPFHAYPTDYHRWTIDGLRETLGQFDIENTGIRTGPTATLLAFVLEFVKVLSPTLLKKPAYGIVGWLIWPLRYLDSFLMKRSQAQTLANHIFALVRKPS